MDNVQNVGQNVCIMLCMSYTCDLTAHPAPSDQECIVSVSWSDSPAGVDYNVSSLPLLLSLPAGSSSIATPLTILADSVVELDEMVGFRLDIPPGAPPDYSIDPLLGSALITILDNNCEELQIHVVTSSSNIHACVHRCSTGWV